MDWDSFNSWEADSSYNAPAVTEVAQTDVLQGTQSAPTGSDQWTGFFQEVVKGAIGYATAKDAAETKVQIAQRQNQAAFTAAAAQRQNNGANLMPLLLIGGLILILKD